MTTHLEYLASASMPMGTTILFSTGTCQTWWRVIMLSFGNWMETLSILVILHSYPLPSRIVMLVSDE